MKIKALQTILHDGKRFRPGEVLELPELDAKVMIDRRFAVSAESTTAPAPVEPTKPAKQKADT